MALLQAANRRIGPLTSALLRAHDIGEQIRSWLVVRRQLRGANCHPPLLPLQVWHPPLLPFPWITDCRGGGLTIVLSGR